MHKKQYLIASSKLWDPQIAEKLSKETGHSFSLIQEKHELSIENLTRISPEIIFFPHWSYIIPDEIHTQFNCIVFHMTDLPYGRGGSPLQNLILAGHNNTKISALKCVDGIDEGPIYLKKELSLAGSATEIFWRASKIIFEMICEIISNGPMPVPQQGTPTLFKRRTPAQSNIETCQSPKETYDMIRMLDAEGYPKAFIVTQGGIRIEFTDAHLKDNELSAKVRIVK